MSDPVPPPCQPILGELTALRTRLDDGLGEEPEIISPEEDGTGKPTDGKAPTLTPAEITALRAAGEVTGGR